jgi:hypothetical protein
LIAKSDFQTDTVEFSDREPVLPSGHFRKVLKADESFEFWSRRPMAD